MRNITAGWLSLFLFICSQLPARADMPSLFSTTRLDPTYMTIAGVGVASIFVALGLLLKRSFDAGAD